MGLIDIMESVLQSTGSLVEEGTSTIAEHAEQIVQDFENTRKNLEKSFKELSINQAELIPEMALELIQSIIEVGEDVNERIGEIVAMSFPLVLNNGTQAVIDFLKMLYDRFKTNFHFFQQVMEEILKFISFEKLWKLIVELTIDHFNDLKEWLEVLLTPIFIVGLAVKGSTKMAELCADYLKSTTSAYITRININEIMPVPISYLHTIRQDSFYDFTKIQYIFFGIFELLRRGGNIHGTNLFFMEIDNSLLRSLMDSVLSFFESILAPFLQSFTNSILQFFQELIRLAEDDIELEWRLLELARFTPLGIFFIIVAVPYKLLTSPAPFLNLLFNPIEDDDNLRTLRLPCPDKENKYIFFSDIHRDAKEDKRPEFQFLSIDHFDPNGAQYLELLEYYDQQGYTIIEVGDCEELWFHRDFSIRPHEKLESIIEKYQAIYDKLKDLHQRGKYYRVFGNHDSYLWEDDATRTVYMNHFDSSEHPFIIYDFIIIDGVKTMQDVPFYLGLDSDPNEDRKPMIVTHGHQWDFWNCDANNILGKLMVSAVGTPLDFLDDPFRDIGGISMSGSPGVNFKEILADLFIYNNWLSKEPANAKADAIQHRPDDTRLFVDDIMYSETLASMMGNLIFVKADNDCSSYETICDEDYVFFNLLCIGHTHNPQNMPYHDLEDIPILGDYIAGFERSLERLTGGFVPFDFLSLIKSNYINTGTAGWWENTIWAMDLGDVSHGTGQAKLINWSGNTKIDQPNQMDWELPHLSHDGPNSKGERLKQLHEDIIQWINSLINDLRSRGEQIVISSPLGGILDLVRSSGDEFSSLEFYVPAELHGILDRLIGIVGWALNQVAIICKEGIDFTIRLRIELPKEYQKFLANHLANGRKSSEEQFMQGIGLLAAKEMISKVQFRDSDRERSKANQTVYDKLNHSLFTLAWLFNPKNKFRGRRNQIGFYSKWRIEKNELLIDLQFEKNSIRLKSKN